MARALVVIAAQHACFLMFFLSFFNARRQRGAGAKLPTYHDNGCFVNSF